MVQTRPIRVVVIDDHETVRYGLAVMFEVMDNFELVGEAADSQQGLALCAQLRPDLVLIELRLLRSDGFCALRLMKKRFPQIKIIVMSASENDEDIQAAYRAGASSYLVKNTGIDEIAATLRAAMFMD
ncbi:MAG: response regulator transcription factor [Chloroflexi bacterium]|nr:response regulator transcription factor [Chloroflexota bacterium]